MLASGSPASQQLSAKGLCYMSTRLCMHEHHLAPSPYAAAYMFAGL